MLKATRIILALLASALFVAALIMQASIADVPTPTDPALDNRYAPVASLTPLDGLGYPDQALVREYDRLRQEYGQQIHAANDERSQLESSRNAFLGFGLFALVLFGIACLPWGRWVSAGVSTAQAAVTPVATFVRDKIAGEGTGIIGQEKLRRYSVAEELLKWTELHEKGVITEDEFNEARSKILKRDA